MSNSFKDKTYGWTGRYDFPLMHSIYVSVLMNKFLFYVHYNVYPFLNSLHQTSEKLLLLSLWQKPSHTIRYEDGGIFLRLTRLLTLRFQEESGSFKGPSSHNNFFQDNCEAIHIPLLCSWCPRHNCRWD